MRHGGGRDSVVGMKIALLQIDPTVGDLDGNAACWRRRPARPGRAGADLAVASELCTPGLSAARPAPAALVRGARLGGRARSWPAASPPGRRCWSGWRRPTPAPRAGRSTTPPRCSPAAPCARCFARRCCRPTTCSTRTATSSRRAARRCCRGGPAHRRVGLRGRLERPRFLAAAPLSHRPHRRPRGGRRRVRREHVGLAVYDRQAAASRGDAGCHRAQVRRAGRSTSTRWAAPTSWSSTGAAAPLPPAASSWPARPRSRPTCSSSISSSWPGAQATGAGPARFAPDDFAPASEVWRALVLGVRDYVAKSGFERALLGLSGGIDSALVAAVAAEALGPQNVLAVLMPSPYSSSGSVTDARALADGLAHAHGDAAHRRRHGRLRPRPEPGVRRSRPPT